MQAWFGFYSAVGGFAATLLGLLFVAISVNAQAILGDPNTRLAAEQAFQNYLAVLIVALLAIIPMIDLTSFGLSTLAVTAVWGGWVLVRFYLLSTRAHDPGSRLRALRRQFTAFVGFGMLIYAAFRMALGIGADRNMFAAATIVLLFSATAVSWELLLKIAGAAKSR